MTNSEMDYDTQQYVIIGITIAVLVGLGILFSYMGMVDLSKKQHIIMSDFKTKTCSEMRDFLIDNMVSKESINKELQPTLEHIYDLKCSNQKRD